MNYFIGDLHFGHVNCLSFDKRPFKTIEDHDAVLIKNWNNVVGIEDDVCHNRSYVQRNGRLLVQSNYRRCRSGNGSF